MEHCRTPCGYNILKAEHEMVFCSVPFLQAKLIEMYAYKQQDGRFRQHRTHLDYNVFTNLQLKRLPFYSTS